MTELKEMLWARLRQIPEGRVSTYGDMAAALGKPKAARAVGGMLATNPDAPRTPCHRVVRSDGSLGGYQGGMEAQSRKRDLLESEGVRVVDGKVQDFDRLRFRDFPPL